MIWPIQNHGKNIQMIENLAHGYSTVSTQLELANEYQHDSGFQKSLSLCALDESSLSIRRVRKRSLRCEHPLM